LPKIGNGFPHCDDAFFNEQVHELSGNRRLVERQGIGVARQILIHSIFVKVDLVAGAVVDLGRLVRLMEGDGFAGSDTM
jgi:hypothetical protein